MSGPKDSPFRIRSSINEMLREERLRERSRQVIELRSRIQISRELMQRVCEEYHELAEHLNSLVNTWISQAEMDINGDLRIAFRGVNGIESYIRKQVPILAEQKARKEQLQEKERLEQEKRREEERKKLLIEQRMKYFDDMKELYPQLINPGIEQRVALFKNALMVNPENEDTLEKMNSFKIQFGKLVEEYELELSKDKYLRKTLSDIIGNDEAGEGGASMSGRFEGVPLTVELDSKDSTLRFEFPDDGSCKPNVSRLVQSFQDAGIGLGPIRIIKTGEVISIDHANLNDRNKTKA